MSIGRRMKGDPGSSTNAAMVRCDAFISTHHHARNCIRFGRPVPILQQPCVQLASGMPRKLGHEFCAMRRPDNASRTSLSSETPFIARNKAVLGRDNVGCPSGQPYARRAPVSTSNLTNRTISFIAGPLRCSGSAAGMIVRGGSYATHSGARITRPRQMRRRAFARRREAFGLSRGSSTRTGRNFDRGPIPARRQRLEGKADCSPVGARSRRNDIIKGEASLTKIQPINQRLALKQVLHPTLH